MPKQTESNKSKRRGWELHSGMFEIFWRNGYADRVRVNGCTFWFISGKRARPVEQQKELRSKIRYAIKVMKGNDSLGWSDEPIRKLLPYSGK